MTGSVTLENIRLSLVAGMAFADFSEAGVLTNAIGGKLTVIDSGGVNKAIGYIKAAGTGETYQTSWADDAADDGTADWQKIDCTLSFDADHYVVTYSAATQHVYKNSGYTVAPVAGALYKGSVDVANGATSGVGVYNQFSGTGLIFGSGTTGAGYASLAGYKTCESTSYIDIYSTMTGAGSYLMKNYILQKVLTPSATGVTITSTPGGSTYNWESIDSGFNYNDASGYRYMITVSSSGLRRRILRLRGR